MERRTPRAMGRENVGPAPGLGSAKGDTRTVEVPSLNTPSCRLNRCQPRRQVP
jgi:hypothetical protein